MYDIFQVLYYFDLGKAVFIQLLFSKAFDGNKHLEL